MCVHRNPLAQALAAGQRLGRKDPDRIGLVELGRTARTGRRLTEAEKRLVRGARRSRGGGVTKGGAVRR